MTERTLLLLVASVYAAAILLLLFAQWHRKRLLKWALSETKWVERESEELKRMRKIIVQQFEWESTRAYHGNLVMHSAFDLRRKEYNRRREKLLEVVGKVEKLLPW